MEVWIKRITDNDGDEMNEKIYIAALNCWLKTMEVNCMMILLINFPYSTSDLREAKLAFCGKLLLFCGVISILCATFGSASSC